MNGNDFVGLAGWGEEIFESAHISREHLVVGRCGIGLLAGEDVGFVGETCEVVDVAIRIIALDAFF